MLINLVAHRRQPLPPARQRWHRACGVALAAGLLVGSVGHGVQSHWAQAQAAHTHTQRAAQAALAQQHAALNLEVTQLQAHLQELQHLQRMGGQAWSVLQLWVSALPPGVVVQSLRQETLKEPLKDAVVLQGLAPLDDSVALWLQRLPAPLQGELLELRSTPWPPGQGQGIVQHFTVRLHVGTGG